MRKIISRWRLYLAESDIKSTAVEEPSVDPSADSLQKAIDIQNKLRDKLQWDQERSQIQKQTPGDAWEQQETRDKIYTAYESGLPRDVYEKYIEREVDKGKIDLQGSDSVSTYYDEKILPRIKDHVYKTPVLPITKGKEFPGGSTAAGWGPGHSEVGAYYQGGDGTPGEIYKSKKYETEPKQKKRWESDVFPHELAHGVQGVTPTSDDPGAAADVDMSYRQIDDLKSLFPDIKKDWERKDTHHKRAPEIHDAIILSRIKGLPGQPARPLSADDIKFLRTPRQDWNVQTPPHAWGNLFSSEYKWAGPEELKGVYNSDLGRALRDKTFLNPNLTDQEIADIINRIAKTDTKGPKRSSMA